MANYPVIAGDKAVHRKSTVADTVDKVTFADDVVGVEVISYGDDDLFVRTDGVDPVIDDPKAALLPKGIVSVLDISIPAARAAGATDVRLRSPGVTKWSVSGVAG